MDMELIKQVTKDLRMTPDEIETLIQILEESSESENGSSEILDYLFNIDYEEQPVDIDTFIEHSDYLGGVLDNGKNIYPYWREVMRDIFDENKGYQEVIFSGAIGVGKSTIAAICMAYILHHLLCLRRPQRYYGLPDSSYLGFAFINLTLDAAFGIGVRKFMDMLKLSPWFLRHGKLVGNVGNESYKPHKGIDILGGSLPRHTIGRDIFSAFMDELSFSGVSDPLRARKQVMDLYTNISRRIQSRFMKAGKVPGKVFLVSSKNKASDFLESYMDSVRHRPDVLIIDEPVWKIKGHTMKLCGETFKLAIGGKLMPSMIVKPSDSIEKLIEFGYRILDVPVEYRKEFENNIEKAMNDIAGIATETSGKFMVVENVKRRMGTIENIFTVPIIKIGLRSDFGLVDFIDQSKLKQYEEEKVYIHFDLSKSGDKTGVSLVIADKMKTVSRIDTNTAQEMSMIDLHYKVIGTVAIEALPGSEIPFYRHKEMVDFVAENMEIGAVSCDGYQSTEMIQYFTLRGFNSSLVSVDRTPNPYYNFRSAIDEDRIDLPDHSLLFTELVQLEQGDTKNLKIDHPYDSSGNPAGSKDMADSITGACWTAFNDKKNAEIINESKEKALKGVEAGIDAVLDYMEEDSDLLTF